MTVRLRALTSQTKWQPAAKPSRRLSRVTIGFWLGTVALGTAGCILGACMPYRHPVAVTISVLWWGAYFGCFGASVGAGIGALPGWRTGRAATLPSPGSDGAACPFLSPPGDSVRPI